MTFRLIALLSCVAERHHVDEIRSALIIKLPRVPLIVYHEGVARAHCVSWPDFTRRRRYIVFPSIQELDLSPQVQWFSQ